MHSSALHSQTGRRALLAHKGLQRHSTRRAVAQCQGANAATAGATVAVKFHLPYKTELGNYLAIVGDAPQLGAWQVEQAMSLTWTQGDEWTVTANVAPGVPLEYKYVVVHGDGTVDWSPGNNYRLEVPEAPGSTVMVYEGWVNDGPRHVEVQEPHDDDHAPLTSSSSSSTSASAAQGSASGGSSSSGGSRDGADSAAGQQQQGSVRASSPTPDQVQATADFRGNVVKLASLTEKLLRQEAENAVLSILATYPGMTVGRLEKSLQVANNGGKKPEMSPEQLQTLLENMVKSGKLVELDGRYSIAKEHPALAAASNMPLPARSVSPGASAGNRRASQEVEAGGFRSRPADSTPGGAASNGANSISRPGAPLPARRASPPAVAMPSNYSSASSNGAAINSAAAAISNGNIPAASSSSTEAADVSVASGTSAAGAGAAPTAAAAASTAAAPSSSGSSQEKSVTGGAPSSVTSVTSSSGPTRQVFVPYIMKLLETRSGMSLEGMRGALSSMTAVNVQASQLAAELAELVSQGRVVLEGSMYKKGVATPSITRARAATPMAARGGPTPSAQALHSHPVPVRHMSAGAPSSSQSSGSSGGMAQRGSETAPRPQQPAGAAQPRPTPAPDFIFPDPEPDLDLSPAQLAALEKRVATCVSNYGTGLSLQRILYQMQRQHAFIGSERELSWICGRLVEQGLLSEDHGLYSTRKSRPQDTAFTPTAPATTYTNPAAAYYAPPPPPVQPAHQQQQQQPPTPQRSTPMPARGQPPRSSTPAPARSTPGMNPSSNGAAAPGAAWGSLDRQPAPTTAPLPAGSMQGPPAAPPAPRPSTPRAARAGTPSAARARTPAAARAGTPAAARAGTPAAARLGAPVRARTPAVSRKVDPAAPKRNLSAYQLYAMENRDRVKAANPGVPAVDITRLVAAEWKMVDGITRARYDELAGHEKERYQRELEAYHMLHEREKSAGLDDDLNSGSSGPYNRAGYNPSNSYGSSQNPGSNGASPYGSSSSNEDYSRNAYSGYGIDSSEPSPYNW